MAIGGNRLSYLEKEPIMLRSAAVISALLIFPSFAQAQELTEVQEGTHEVVTGETLWELADRYLGDPYRWPLIFEANQDRVEDPHWIYPGQFLVIPGLEMEAGPAQIQEVAIVTPGERPVPVSEELPPCPGPDNRTRFYQGTDGDRGCRTVIPTDGERTAFYSDPNAITEALFTDIGERMYAVPRGVVFSTPWLEGWGTETAGLGYVSGLSGVDSETAIRDRAVSYERLQVTLDEGVQLRVGDLLQVIAMGRAEEDFGQVVRPTGILVVSAVEEAGVVALVSTEYGRVKLGQRIRMAPEYSVPLGDVAQEVESNVQATLLGFDEDRLVQGFGAIAFLDVEENAGIAPGDEFSLFLNDDDGWEGEEGARLQVVLVNGSTASARVIVVNDPVLEAGSPLRLVRKMQ